MMMPTPPPPPVAVSWGVDLTDSMQPDDFPLGSPVFVAQWCTSKIAIERVEIDRVLALARHPGSDISAQCAWNVFKALYPARVLHLLRALPHDHSIELVESLSDLLIHFLKQFLQFQDLDVPHPCCMSSSQGRGPSLS